jgi:lysophospholipase L1-like esterase
MNRTASSGLRHAVVFGTATIVAVLLGALASEAWVRLTWQAKRGAPGFFLSDPVRIEKLGADYTGWFSGVPIHLNALGFRDTRDYDLKKGPRTFRILVLGDSVTFGDGSIFEHTYPRLMQGLLGRWRPDVDWQVWNLGVPGYNTTQELAQLLEVGPRFQPDLVIVGFFANDVTGNYDLRQPSRRQRLTSEIANALRRHMYSFELYRRLYLQWRTGSAGGAMAEPLLANLERIEHLDEQQLTPVVPIDPDAFANSRCGRKIIPPTADPERSNGLLRAAAETDPGLRLWKAAVRGFQDLHRTGAYRIVFFINMAPSICDEFFDPRATRDTHAYFLRVLGAATSVVSSHDALARYRPVDMPGATEHSLGNTNLVKAQVLAEFLEQQILPSALSTK